MHGIFLAAGSRGDLYPVLGLGRAMHAEGHSVTVITTGNFEAEVQAAGLEYVELADSATYWNLARWSETEGLSRSPRRWRKDDIDALLEVRESLVARVDGIVPSGPAFLGVTVGLDLGAGDIIAERHGLPKVGVWINAHQFSAARIRLPRALRQLPRVLFNGFLRAWPEGRILRRHDAELRHRLGVAPEPDLARAMYSFDLDVALFPAWYLPGHARRAGMTFVGFPMFEPDMELSNAVDEFLDAGKPPIVFSNASWRSNLDEYYAAALDITRHLGRRAVLVGPGSPDVPAGRDDAISTGFTSFKRLLPRAAALVHHGGIGTVARAMAEATPQLVVPWSADQPFNADRVEKLGVGRRVGTRSSAGQFTARLTDVLESQSIRANTLRVSRRLARGPDYQEALRSLEREVEGVRA